VGFAFPGLLRERPSEEESFPESSSDSNTKVVLQMEKQTNIDHILSLTFLKMVKNTFQLVLCLIFFGS
jgi:hypothetical protein